MRKILTPAIGLLCTVSMASMAHAEANVNNDQDNVETTQEETPEAQEGNGGIYGDFIIVTAQRQAQKLQDVPIAVSAFSGDALESAQIENSSDLQITLPNVTFTKTNFTGSSFTIRGIGDLCVGTTCDSATGIHLNDLPMLNSRLFETEYFDVERIEVLRGPQGTLFGRNATSGVVNVHTKRPELSEFTASGSFEYGNYDSYKVKGHVNVPIGDTLAIRAAGYYLNRDGYTKNEYNNTDIDGRDLYSVRGSILFEPTPDTRLHIMGSYFRENDDRSRIQKQLCNYDPSGILGCLPDKLENEQTNRLSTLGSIVSSREFLSIAGSPALAPFGLHSLFDGTYQQDITQPLGLRNVSLDFTPEYFADEWVVMGNFDHDFETMSFHVTGGYKESRLDDFADYFLAVGPTINKSPGSGLGNFNALLGNTPVGQAFTDANGNICLSDPAPGTHAGNGGGFTRLCSPQESEFDRNHIEAQQWSVEAHLDSDFDGPFNFLIGGLYLDSKITQNDYAIISSGIDYAAAVLGYAQSTNPALGAAPGSLYMGAPFFNNFTDSMNLKSWGVFGEVYFDISDTLKFTGGLRYSNDKKHLNDRNVVLNFPVPVGETNIFNSPYSGAYDADGGTPGNQIIRDQRVSFDEVTGRAVIDWKVTPDNLIYASYSRGYKSGGINPPFNPTLFPNAQTYFKPEIVNAFEIGSKNTIGAFQINATAFYYQYDDLQLSRIIARTSFNDNTNADIFGVELEGIARVSDNWTFNANFSYLHTSIGNLSLVDTRDPTNGRSDVVLIKDITTASNCVVAPNAALPASALVNAVNAGVGLPGAAPVDGINGLGAYSICNALAATAAGAFGGAFTVSDGIAADLSGNKLPQAPEFKVAVGAQYDNEISDSLKISARADLALTGDYFSRQFNRPIDKVGGYEQLNVSVTLSDIDDKWFVSGFVQNATNNQDFTGQYVTDAATGLFTNVFTLDPRRYGIVVGFNY